MRLLYLTADPGIPVYGEKGASIHVRALVGAFAALGHEVILASPRLEAGSGSLAPAVDCVEIPGVCPRECATPEEVLAQASRQGQAVAQLARDERVEGIYERYSLASAAGARASRVAGIPLVLEVNAPLREEERRFRQLAHESAAIAAERETFGQAALIVAVSAALAEWLVSAGLEPSRIEVIENAPPEREFASKPALDGDDQVVVGFSGSLKPWHGIDTLARGFELAAARGARMRLEIAGAGPAGTFLDACTLSGDHLRRLGHLPHAEALDLLARWDVGVAPYADVNGFYFSPLKLLEYMAAGLCPVVTDVGELARLVEHGQAGVVIPPGDPDALARALLLLDRDRVRLRRLGRRARELALARPSWSDTAQRVIAAFEHATSTMAVAEGNRR